MELNFSKYQGTGNDFIMVDGRMIENRLQRKEINKLCERRFGIGADGLIEIIDHPDLDFEMIYYNSDGRESTMCGNGGRCAVAFAKELGLIQSEAQFMAVDGSHWANINENNWVNLGMKEVDSIKRLDDFTFVMDTGSPHYVYFPDKNEELDIVNFGKKIRFSSKYKEEGINVNLVRKKDNYINVETYERGVENETLSCGTGVTAAAIAFLLLHPESDNHVRIVSKGGSLRVHAEKRGQKFENVILSGPAKKVFSGKINLSYL